MSTTISVDIRACSEKLEPMIGGGGGGLARQRARYVRHGEGRERVTWLILACFARYGRAAGHFLKPWTTSILVGMLG